MPNMTLPDSEHQPQPKDTRPITALALKEETDEERQIRERKPMPQPPAGIDLSVMDPVPNAPDYHPIDKEPE